MILHCIFKVDKIRRSTKHDTVRIYNTYMAVLTNICYHCL